MNPSIFSLRHSFDGDTHLGFGLVDSVPDSLQDFLRIIRFLYESLHTGSFKSGPYLRVNEAARYDYFRLGTRLSYIRHNLFTAELRQAEVGKHNGNLVFFLPVTIGALLDRHGQLELYSLSIRASLLANL